MKMLQGTEETTTYRKILKSQMEKRRRERMNCSLEHLRTLLLQEPPQLTAAQQKLEKAEILKHTVLLLQSSTTGDLMGAGGGGGGGGGGQRHSFQDGFSSCLQRAAQFLGPQGKGLRLGASQDARFAARFAPSDSDPTGVPLRTEARSCSCSLTQTKSILRMLRQKSKLRVQTQTFGVNSSLHPYQRPEQLGSPRVPQSQLEVRVSSRGGKQSLSQSFPVSQTLWRPWP
ncbi:transcription factor HES-7.1-B-like [Hippoglossus hippoglossus]|uniref:transcription factor HES-7.1-B-like n=1 Tax=Hippoglossus hippoglossus TaxID=8267 RepID=UPI00148DC98A|nr:transcription factor HES-7.1-B-like [Hippoglossus hippoglossus]